MLRPTNPHILRAVQPVWRSSVTALRYQSTSAATPSEPKEEQTGESKQQPKRKTSTPLSARLGGSGRGKPLDSVDPFSQFLSNARKPGNARRPGNNDRRRIPSRDGAAKPKPQPGQFDDAKEAAAPSQPVRQPRAKAGDKPRQPRYNNNNKQNRADGPRRDRDMPRRQTPKFKQPEQSARRVTTFIDKDIDWDSFNALSEVSSATTTPAAEAGQNGEQTERLLAEMQAGDYTRYLSAGDQLAWSPAIQADPLNILVGGNPSYSLDQKTAFLSAIANATKGREVARK